MLSLNHAIFLAINAATAPGDATMLVVRALASAPVLLAPALLAGLWLWGRKGARAGLIATGLCLFAAQMLNWCLGQVVYQPRPFMAGIGHTWIDHLADNGFPSDHTALAWSLGLGLILTRSSPAWGRLALVAGLAAGWARVFLGVHFPLDILGSAPTALLAALLARAIVPVVRTHLLPVAERLQAVALRPLAAAPRADRT